MSAQFSLGDANIRSTSQLRDYCNNGRLLIRPLANELRIAAEELQAALKELPGGNVYLLGTDTRVRARIVASHLRHAAEGVEATCGSLVRTFLSFDKHFVQSENAKNPKRIFNINE